MNKNINSAMLRCVLLLAVSVATVLPTAAKSVVIDGLRYELLDKGQTSVSSADGNLVDVVIPSTIAHKGRTYDITAIDRGGFKGCKRMKSLVIPNSVRKIGKEAFWDCKGLESVVMPDECEVEIPEGSYGFGKWGIFHGCKSLKKMRGTTMLYPEYMVFDALYDCKEVPFYETASRLDRETIASSTISAKFSEFAAKIKKPIEDWQRRKSYETMAQWEARVTEANRKAMIEEAITEAKSEFLKTFAPPSLSGILEDYNMDYGFYSVNLGQLGTVYATVPQDEAENFAKNWKQVKIEPVYGILDNTVGILSCKFELGENTYRSPSAYTEDDFDPIAMTIVPLAAVREYELAAAKRTEVKQEQRTYETDVVDIDIPAADQTDNTRTFAVIIGNENYQRVAHVDYAMNDARIFAKYCERTLGIPETNIRTYYDATFGDILAAMDDIKNVTDAFDGEVNIIFYYAGHGMPDESNRNAFIIPIDATGTQPEACYPLSKLYAQLGELNAKSVVAFVDACFSGSLRGDGMLASARGIKIKPRDVPADGKLVVLSAASGDQTAFPYHEKGHGLFSYYLIKKLYDTKGDTTLGELADYVCSEVAQQAVVVNQKPQTPGVKASTNMGDSWRKLRLR